MASSSCFNSGQHSHGHPPQHQPFAASSHSPLPSVKSGVASPVYSNLSAVVDENFIIQDYRPPGGISSSDHPKQEQNLDHALIANKKVQWVYNPTDGSVVRDHNGIPLSVDRLLATNPLRHELSTRPGPGNKKLTYISGDDVSRTLNDIFGFDGWDLDIQNVTREDNSKDPKTGKYTVVYTARVRLTHKASGAYKEDCGAGDSTDRSFATAIAHALKASITDAMKRAARHFGDKLGNSLYSGNFSINKAPVSLKDALDKYDIRRCNTKFGFQHRTKSGSSDSGVPTARSATHEGSRITAPTASAPKNPRQQQQQQQQQQQSVQRTQISKNMQHEQMKKAPVSTSNSSHNEGFIAAKDRKMVTQQCQYQNYGHQQQQYHQSTSSNGNSSNSRSSTLQNSNSHPNASGLRVTPHSSHSERQTSYSSLPQQGPSTVPTAITNNRVSSAFVQRPTLESTTNNETIPSGLSSISSDIFPQPLKPSNSICGRGVSDQMLHQQHPPNPMHTRTIAHSSNNKAANPIGNLPKYGGDASNKQQYQQKRPPLGSIGQNANSASGSTETVGKRPKYQHHHNPYQQSYGGGRKSI